MRKVYPSGFFLISWIVGNAMMLPEPRLVAGVASSLAIILADCSATIEVPAADAGCPVRCEDMFGKLDNGVQEVHVQIRGEPKSGTTTSGEWAWGALVSTCMRLKRLYGEQSCSTTNEFQHHEMVFEPELASGDDTRLCSCKGVTRVVHSVSMVGKHVFPVEQGCAYWHTNDIIHDSEVVCQGAHPRDQIELWKCAQEANCTFNDQRLQLLALRDPRAVTVNAYFHQLRRSNRTSNRQVGSRFPSVDDYFQTFLPATCMWVSLRYYVFTQTPVAAYSQVHFYEDHEIDPVDWHGRYLSFVGLILPLSEVTEISRVATGGDISNVLGYHAVGRDNHPGGQERSTNRTFRDELGPDSLSNMDDVLRTWLPPVLLKEFGLLK